MDLLSMCIYTNGLYICGIDKIRFDDFNGVILQIFKVVFGLAYILLIINVYNWILCSDKAHSLHLNNKTIIFVETKEHF